MPCSAKVRWCGDEGTAGGGRAPPVGIDTDDYLAKPFSFVVLTARLRALQRRGAPERPTVLTAGDLSLDPARRRVSCQGSIANDRMR